MSDTPTQQNTTLRKALRIAADVLLLLLVALALFCLIITVLAKRDSDGAATVFGYQLRFVRSASMEQCDQTDVSGYKIKSIPTKSCIFVQVAPTDEDELASWYAQLQKGDVLTFKYTYDKQETITHRIVDIAPNQNGGYTIKLQGDNVAEGAYLMQQVIDTSGEASFNYVIGKVTGQSYLLGLIIYILNTKVGLICVVIIPCAIMIFLQILRIVRVVSNEQRQRLLAQQTEQANEIEELKRKLAELQGNRPSDDD